MPTDFGEPTGLEILAQSIAHGAASYFNFATALADIDQRREEQKQRAADTAAERERQARIDQMNATTTGLQQEALRSEIDEKKRGAQGIGAATAKALTDAGVPGIDENTPRSDFSNLLKSGSQYVKNVAGAKKLDVQRIYEERFKPLLANASIAEKYGHNAFYQAIAGLSDQKAQGEKFRTIMDGIKASHGEEMQQDIMAKLESGSEADLAFALATGANAMRQSSEKHPLPGRQTNPLREGAKNKDKATQQAVQVYNSMSDDDPRKLQFYNDADASVRAWITPPKKGKGR